MNHTTSLSRRHFMNKSTNAVTQETECVHVNRQLVCHWSNFHMIVMMHKDTSSGMTIKIDSPGLVTQTKIDFNGGLTNDGMDTMFEHGSNQSSCVGVKKKSHCIGEFIIVKFGFSLGIDALLHENNDMSTFVDALQSDH